MRFVLAFIVAWFGFVTPIDATRDPSLGLTKSERLLRSNDLLKLQDARRVRDTFKVAQYQNFPPGVFGNRGALDAAPSGGCSQATTVLARYSGSPNTAAVTTLICGLATDGTYSSMDVGYLFAIDSSSNTAIDISSAGTHNATTIGAGTFTFTANQGIVFNNSGAVNYNTGFAPSGGTNCTQNNCSALVCIQSTFSANQVEFGSTNGASYFYLIPQSGGSTQYNLNDASFLGYTNASSTGLWIMNRTSITALALYNNGTLGGSGTAASAIPNAQPIYIGGYNNSGTPAGPSLDQIGGFAIFSGLSGGQVTSVNGRFHTYFTTVFGSSPC